MYKQTPSWLTLLEFVITGVLAPWFLVPSMGFRVWMLFIPLLLGGLRRIICGQWASRTPLNIPIFCMGVMLSIGILVTCDTTLSLPKVAGIFYGIVVYFTITNNLSWNHVERIALPTLLSAGFAMAGLSLFGMRWTGAKLPLIGSMLQQVGQSIPRLLIDIPRAGKGISTNQLGGTLILLIPMQASLFIYSLKTPNGKILDWVKTIGIGACLCLSLFVLLLTQSRGAIAALLVVLSAVSLFYLRHRRWLIILIFTLSLVVGSALLFGFQTDDLFSETELGDISASFSLSKRPEIWERAYRMLQDHPYTGIGLDTFPKVLSARYPTFILPMERAQVVPHAHNLYLQTALDLGIPGLIAFLALHAIVGWMLVRTIRYAHSPLLRATAIGLLLGLGAQLLYGWVDCIALGQKPGILNWVYLALSTVIYKIVFEHPQKQDQLGSLRQVIY